MKKAVNESEVASLFEKQTKCVKFIRKSNTANRILRHHQVRLHNTTPNPFDVYHTSLGWKIYPHRPVRTTIGGKTRWWSRKKQNKRFVRLKLALQPTLGELLENDDISADKKMNFDFTQNDWKVFEQCDDILDPFKKAIKELEGEKYPTLSLVTMHIFSLLDFVNNRRANIQANSEWSKRVLSLLKFLKKGLKEIISELPEEAYIASLLDPRCLDTFIPADLRQDKWNRLNELLAEFPDDPAEVPAVDGHVAEPPRPARPGTRSQPLTPPPKLSYEDIMKKKLVARGADRATEKPYRELQPLGFAERVNILKWWKANESVYPRHARLARRYLAIPASSAPCERLFSTGGRVLEKRRATLKPSTARAIVFLHDNRHLLDDIDEVPEEYLNDE
jgi:hypothetical protein